MRKGFAIYSFLGAGLFLLSCVAAVGQVFTIIDENVDELLTVLTNGNGVPAKTQDANSGSEALEVGVTGGDGQNFNPAIPDWSFDIVENPTATNEFRYITFAWKKDGGEGIQLQIHGDPDTWGHRYHAGQNVQNWNPSIQVLTTIPAQWTSHTQDLFADWGEFTITGMAFTAWDGNAGLWDDVFLHQDADLTPVEPKEKLTTTWAEIKASR